MACRYYERFAFVPSGPAFGAVNKRLASDKLEPRLEQVKSRQGVRSNLGTSHAGRRPVKKKPLIIAPETVKPVVEHFGWMIY